MSSIVIEQKECVTTISGINTEEKLRYIPDTVICERLSDDTYTFLCNSQAIMGDCTITKDALRMYRDVIIAMIGAE